MRDLTGELLAAVVAATPERKYAALKVLRGELTGIPTKAEPDRLLRPRVAAFRLGVTARTVFNLMKSGGLTRVWLPGRQRGVGVRESQVAAIVAGGGGKQRSE